MSDGPCATCPVQRLGIPCIGLVMGAVICRRHDPASPHYRADMADKTINHSFAAAGATRPRTFPPLLAQAVSAAKAVAQHVAAGCPTVTPEVKAARLAVCEGCDRYERGRCLACGCHMATKAAWELSTCPLDKWPAASEPAP